MRLSAGKRWRIKNRTFLQWVTVLVAVWAFLIKPISILPGPLSYLKYVPDGILFAMLLLCMGRERITVKRDMLTVLRIAIGFFVYCFVVYIFRYQSVAYFLWGFRNNFRFYIAFFAFIALLDESDVASWFRFVDVLFWVNAVVSVFQFVFLGFSGDYLGGIFGTRGASNGFSLCIMSIVLCKSFLEAFEEKESLAKSLTKCAVAILISAMAELKFFFFVMIFLLIGAAIITRTSIKKVVYLVLAICGLMLGAILLVSWFGFEGFFTLKKLWENATQPNYSSNNDINRLTAIPSLIQRLDLSPMQQFFGLGLGNCDTASFSICNTPFYRHYDYLHYIWFTTAMIFLETGYLGLGLYISFFVACFWQAYKQFKACKGNQLYNRMAIIMSIFCAVLAIYNASLRTEAGYMMYFVMALPFVRQSSDKKAGNSAIVLPKGAKSYENE